MNPFKISRVGLLVGILGDVAFVDYGDGFEGDGHGNGLGNGFSDDYGDRLTGNGSGNGIHYDLDEHAFQS